MSTLVYGENTVNGCTVTLQFAAQHDPTVRKQIAQMLLSSAMERLKTKATDPERRTTAAQNQPEYKH